MAEDQKDIYRVFFVVSALFALLLTFSVYQYMEIRELIEINRHFAIGFKLHQAYFDSLERRLEFMETKLDIDPGMMGVTLSYQYKNGQLHIRRAPELEKLMNVPPAPDDVAHMVSDQLRKKLEEARA